MIPGIGLWSFYFLTELYLNYRGVIRLDIILNLVFFAFLVVPIPEKLKAKKVVYLLKVTLGVVVALVLLWKQSWLPPPLEAFQHLKAEGIPTKEYIFSFLMRYFSLYQVMVLMAILTISFSLRKWKVMTPVVLALLLVSPLMRPDGSATMIKKATKKMASAEEVKIYTDSFFEKEAKRVVHFKKSKKADPDFDIVLLHICSLSWDDVKAAALDARFFDQFHYLFTNFNTVTAYSGPAVIRVLRASCGQQRHDDLFEDTKDECYLFDGLNKVGFENYFAANHDGKYGDFAKLASELGHIDAPLLVPDEISHQQFMFDNSLVYNDYAALEKWWKVRQKSDAGNAALYYNSVTLHEGSHWAPKKKEWWKEDRKVLYKEFAAKLLDDMNRFFKLLESSERNTVVLFVSEHGMAFEGSKIQVEGLRDIPLPEITLGPLGIRFIGKGFDDKPVDQKIISKPTSYLTIASMISSMIKRSPYDPERFNERHFERSILKTDFLSENLGVKITKMEGDYYLYDKSKKWIPLPAR